MRRGFTLLEMLVVIGIIAVLVAATVGGYAGITRAAEKQRCRELVQNVATALTVMYDAEGRWPKALVKEGMTDGKLDAQTALRLADHFSLNVGTDKSSGSRALIGLDRFGIVTPWATAVLKRSGKDAPITTRVPGGRSGVTIEDHILHFAVDSDGDGIVKAASVGGESVSVRAKAIVWCCGRDGKIEPYRKGLKADDVYSWAEGQTRDVP